jgi:hypothetical protein
VTPNDWRRVKELFSTAVALDESEQDSFLDAQPDTEEVVGEARSLLAAYLESPDFLEGSAPELQQLEPIDQPEKAAAWKAMLEQTPAK